MQRWWLVVGLVAGSLVGCATTPANREDCQAQARRDFDDCATAARGGALAPAAVGVNVNVQDPNTARDAEVADRRSCATAYEKALKTCRALPRDAPAEAVD